MKKVDERHNYSGHRHDHSRKINFADQTCIINQSIRGLAQTGRKKGPRQNAGKHHQCVRRIAIGWQFGDTAENDRKYQHGRKRPNDCPQYTNDGLFVAD